MATRKMPRRLPDAEPENHQRDQRQVRDVAGHLHAAVEQPAAQREEAVEQPQREPDVPPMTKPMAARWALIATSWIELALAQQVEPSLGHIEWRRQDAHGDDAGHRQRLPDDQDQRRHNPGHELAEDGLVHSAHRVTPPPAPIRASARGSSVLATISPPKASPGRDGALVRRGCTPSLGKTSSAKR